MKQSLNLILCNMKIIILIFFMFLIYSFNNINYISAYVNTYPHGEEPEPKNTTPCISDNWGFCKWNCTSYAAWKVRENYLSNFENYYTYNNVSTNYGHAFTWTNAATSHGFDVSTTPSKGAVAVWQPNRGYASISEVGHVAYVEDINADGSIVISQYNENLMGAYSEATLSGDNLDSVQYIKFGDTSNTANSCSGQSNMIISTTKNNLNCGVSNLIYLSPNAKITGESRLYIN